GRLGGGAGVEDARRHELGDEELIVVAKAGNEPALRLELPVTHRAELFQDLDHAQELLPVRAAKLFELPPAHAEPLGDGLELPPLPVAAGGGAPRAAVALDRGEHGLGTLGALALDELGHRQTRELGGQVAEAAVVGALPVAAPGRALAPPGRAVARHVERRCRPEDALDHSALHPHGDPVRQERIDEHAATADRVDAEHHREGRRPAAPDQHETPRLRLRDGALSTPRPAAQRLTTRLDLLARASVAADALKVTARGGIAPQLLERGLESVDVGLDLANALEILILAERRLDAPAQGLRGGAGREKERHRAVAELELALDRLGRAIDHPENVLESVAGVERDDTRALGIDPASPGSSCHLGQLVVREGAETTVRPLCQPLEDDRSGRHVDAEGHRLRREDDLTESALEQ